MDKEGSEWSPVGLMEHDGIFRMRKLETFFFDPDRAQIDGAKYVR